MAILTISDGPESGRKYTIDHDNVTIGREEDCDLRLDQTSISRHHACLRKMSTNWQLEDLNSQNGVFINGERIHAPKSIFTKCDIRFGMLNTVFDPEIAESPSSISSIAFTDQGEMSDDQIKIVHDMGDISKRILTEFGKVIIGQHEVAEQLLISIAAGGHCLMIGLPGLAKTLMVSTLAQVLNLNFKRVQFTPDLMPSDIIGTDILDIDSETGKKSFRFIRGPIFTNLLLADEINRTPPKTQAALLEAMQEKQVTISNQNFKLSPPFFVLATQNPLEQEGTYPLPEAQLDRFMFNIFVDYPDESEEEAIIMATTGNRDAQLNKILSADDIVSLQNIVRALPISPHIVKYATRLVRMTRPVTPDAPEFIKRLVSCGAGPRAAQCLILGAKSRAVLQGRVNVNCSDVRALVLPVLRHRIFTNFTADSEGKSVDDIIENLLKAVPEPDIKNYK